MSDKAIGDAGRVEHSETCGLSYQVQKNAGSALS
jgi:hypothetical protein